MDRLKLSTKALLGMATRTVDQDHGMRHTCVKSLFQAVVQYEFAISKLVAALSTLSDSLEGVEKAYKNVISNEKQVSVFDGLNEVTNHLEKCRTTVISGSIETFRANVAPSLSALKEHCELCERLHNERAKAVDLYDYHRDVVEKKEVQYASKGKLLDDSKRYKEEISKRDAAHDAYLAKHSEYNKAYDEFMCKKSELTTLSGRLFFHELLDIAEKLKNEVSSMCDVVDQIPLNPVGYKETSAPLGGGVDAETNVIEYTINRDSSEAKDADAAVLHESTDEQSPAEICGESKNNAENTTGPAEE
ncbi:hypothetical protein C3747_144g94 [Trypanosoma cruzi]|uniref:BAR domain-containing protein n=2 Tax=Trypanosoma cruzi TaxID=5693 RepID=A0A2V2W9C3_TRYCR|nr:hypothetical protein C3747_144g94 [Trypanosoma cruzi]